MFILFWLTIYRVHMMWGFKRFLDVPEYISKNKTIIQLGLLKMRANLNLVSIKMRADLSLVSI